MLQHEVPHTLAVLGLGMTTGMAIGLFLPGVTRFESEQIDEWIGGFVTIAPAFLLGAVSAVWSLAVDYEIDAVRPWWWGAIIASIGVLGLDFGWFVPTNYAVLYARERVDIGRTRLVWIVLHVVRMALLIGAFAAATHATIAATHARACHEAASANATLNSSWTLAA